jgi:glycosyltransferase involved in cell wall biosynthesis
MPLDGLHGASRFKVNLLNDAYERAERFAARRCDVIVSVAEEMTRQFLDRRIGRPEQFETVHSGIDVEPYLVPAPGESREEVRARLGFQPRDIVIGTVARLAEHKGHDDLLESLGAALRTTRHLKLLWVGDGWWRDRLIEKARAMQLTISAPRQDETPMIVLSGLVEPARVPGLMRAMDILAHPSLREGLPRTVPQALLCGVPPVAYDSDGTREACIHERTGLLVPRGDSRRLGAEILRLAGSESLRQHLGTQGFAFVRETFCAERMITELERVYARALRLRGEPGAI